MSTPTLVRHRDLLNLLVIDRATTDELGRIEVVWMHPPAHRVLGFICKTGPLGGPKFAFNLSQIDQLGPESVVVNGDGVATNASEVKLLESLIGLEVWSDKGTKIGRTVDCLFNLKSGVITQYLFRSEGWRGITGGVYQLPTGNIQRFGKKRVFVSGAVTHRPQLYRAGLEEKLSKVGDRLQSRFSDLSQQATQQLHQVTDEATAQVQALTEQATQRVQSLGQQLTEETQSLAQLARQRGQVLRSHLQDPAPNDHAADGQDDLDWLNEDWGDREDSNAAPPDPASNTSSTVDDTKEPNLAQSVGLQDIPDHLEIPDDPDDPEEDDQPWI